MVRHRARRREVLGLINLTFIVKEKTKKGRFFRGVVRKRKDVFGFEYIECEELLEHSGGNQRF